MALNAAGEFTGKRPFDAVILTTQDVDSQDIMYAALSGTNLSDLLTQEFADAAALNSAAAALAAAYGAPPKPIQVAITLPWLNPAETSVTLPGTSTAENLSVAAQRMSVATWYLQQVKSMARPRTGPSCPCTGSTTSGRTPPPPKATRPTSPR